MWGLLVGRGTTQSIFIKILVVHHVTSAILMFFLLTEDTFHLKFVYSCASPGCIKITLMYAKYECYVSIYCFPKKPIPTAHVTHTQNEEMCVVQFQECSKVGPKTSYKLGYTPINGRKYMGFIGGNKTLLIGFIH